MTTSAKSGVIDYSASGWLEPRGYLGTTIMLAIPTGLGFAVGMKLLTGMPTQTALCAGILFGIVLGSIMAVRFKGIAVRYQCPWSLDIAGRLQMILAQIAYHPESTIGDTVTFKPSFQAGLLAGRITVSGHRDHIEVFGPSSYVRRLLWKLDKTDCGKTT
jgi:hypothetical protein